MKKVKRSLSMVNMERSIKNGMSVIWMRSRMFKQRDSTRNSDSTSTDHSTSDQDSQ